MLNVFVHTPESFSSPRLRYLLSFLEEHPLAGGEILFQLNGESEGCELSIAYGAEPLAGQWHVPAQGLFFRDEPVDLDHLAANRYGWQDRWLYSVEGQPRTDAKLFFDGSSFGFDLFETIFFHLSRYEEFFPGKLRLDRFGRPREEDFFSVGRGIEQIPVVDQLVEAFYRALGLIPRIRETEWVMTHDIDKIFKYNSWLDAFKAVAWPVVYRFDLPGGLRNLARFFRVRSHQQPDPYDSYSWLFRRSGIWSQKVVYFMAGGTMRYDLFDRFYEKHLPAVFRQAADAGYQPGLHPSFNSAVDSALMKEEKNRLEQMTGVRINHTRQHFLRFIPLETPGYIEESSFTTDSSLGYTRRIGFRCGTGFAYALYDFQKEKAFSFKEWPLVVMDSALIHQTGDDMDQFRKQLLDFVRRNSRGTRIVFNFHNSSFDPTLRHRQHLQKIYIELENHCGAIAPGE